MQIWRQTLKRRFSQPSCGKSLLITTVLLPARQTIGRLTGADRRNQDVDDGWNVEGEKSSFGCHVSRFQSTSVSQDEAEHHCPFSNTSPTRIE